jgi:CBS domain-containing protein
VTVQIHDYAHLKSESLSTARGIVTRAYKNIGVGIEWLGAIQWDVDGSRSAPGEGLHAPIAQLTINILTPSMAARGGVPANVLGFVAVPTEGGMGRIGYVVYERIPDVATASQVSEGEVLGVIVAHDIRRLILGADSPSGDGVMKGRGDRERANPLSLEFTPSEVTRLHAALESNSASVPGAVGTGGTDPQHQCVTGGTGVR